MTLQMIDIAECNTRYASMATADVIADAALTHFKNRIAVVSSFGAESAVLLHLVASVDPAIPVIFLDTHKLFGETLRYRTRLQHHLGLEDVRVIGPRKCEVDSADPQGVLSMTDPDTCCDLRKTRPLSRALEGFDCWINGRKRHQTAMRSDLDILERDGARFKLNPLADWGRAQINAYISTHRLPAHPLIKENYLSIGCIPCTERAVDPDDARSGRWAGQTKTECGIHLNKPKNSG